MKKNLIDRDTKIQTLETEFKTSSDSYDFKLQSLLHDNDALQAKLTEVQSVANFAQELDTRGREMKRQRDEAVDALHKSEAQVSELSTSRQLVESDVNSLKSQVKQLESQSNEKDTRQNGNDDVVIRLRAEIQALKKSRTVLEVENDHFRYEVTRQRDTIQQLEFQQAAYASRRPDGNVARNRYSQDDVPSSSSSSLSMLLASQHNSTEQQQEHELVVNLPIVSTKGPKSLASLTASNNNNNNSHIGMRRSLPASVASSSSSVPWANDSNSSDMHKYDVIEREITQLSLEQRDLLSEQEKLLGRASRTLQHKQRVREVDGRLQVVASEIADKRKLLMDKPL